MSGLNGEQAGNGISDLLGNSSVFDSRFNLDGAVCQPHLMMIGGVRDAEQLVKQLRQSGPAEVIRIAAQCDEVGSLFSVLDGSGETAGDAHCI